LSSPKVFAEAASIIRMERLLCGRLRFFENLNKEGIKPYFFLVIIGEKPFI
jgi:hypothetical protein